MGVPGVLKLLKAGLPDNSPSVPVLDTLTGKSVAVDASIFLHLILLKHGEELFFHKARSPSADFLLRRPDFAFTSRVVPVDWADWAMEFFTIMRQIHAGCKSLFVVFDGKRSPRKLVDLTRDASRAAATDDILLALSNGSKVPLLILAL